MNVNEKLERMRKKRFSAVLRYYLNHHLKGLRETTENLCQVRRTLDVPNKEQQCWPLIATSGSTAIIIIALSLSRQWQWQNCHRVQTGPLVNPTEYSMNIAQWYSCGLRAQWLGIRVPVGAGNFSLHHRIQTGSGVHSTSYPTDTRGSFSGSKATGAWSWPLTSI
jgi:hypothetical protein